MAEEIPPTPLLQRGAFPLLPPLEKGAGGICQPGFYGKLPELGDFVQRRLPSTFIQPWDQWLRESLASSRAQLGEQWLDVYLVSPLWRFVLTPGVVGQLAWAGVLMPSVDRVGRYFPLTIASQLDSAIDCFDCFCSAEDWFTRAEAVALMGLQEGCDLATFDAQVLALGSAQWSVGSGQSGQFGSRWRSSSAEFCYPELPPPAQFRVLLAGG
ncbi:type VI secretion system-associated protein TagF [Chromatium okenii]|uniref:type VI secretion system-associated protein TagF n=1 Tax=Chromatium okenii TaxID=61644 RepID=UPI001F5B73D9|nr:type VI secretion system-associated protein TagF [Chromatium okenii]